MKELDGGVLGLGHIQGQFCRWRPQGLSILMGEEVEDRLQDRLRVELEPSRGGLAW